MTEKGILTKGDFWEMGGSRPGDEEKKKILR